MTEQEFRQDLDAVVTKGLNTLDVGVIYGQIATILQFVEIVYGTNVVNHLQKLQFEQSQAKGNVTISEDVASNDA